MVGRRYLSNWSQYYIKQVKKNANRMLNILKGVYPCTRLYFARMSGVAKIPEMTVDRRGLSVHNQVEILKPVEELILATPMCGGRVDDMYVGLEVGLSG